MWSLKQTFSKYISRGHDWYLGQGATMDGVHPNNNIFLCKLVNFGIQPLLEGLEMKQRTQQFNILP